MRTLLSFSIILSVMSIHSLSQAATGRRCQIGQEVSSNFETRKYLPAENERFLSELEACELNLTLDQDGKSAPIQFDVAAGAESISIAVLSNGEAESLNSIFELVDPSGAKLVDPSLSGKKTVSGRLLTAAEVSPNPLGQSPLRPVSVNLVPSVPEINLKAGKWAARISSDEQVSSSVRSIAITVKYSKSKRPSKLHQLALNLYIAPGAGLPSVGLLEQLKKATGLGPLDMELRDLREFYASIGIKVVIRNLKPLDERYNRAAVVNTFSFSPEISSLMTDFPAAPGELNVFLIKPSNNLGFAGLAPIGCGALAPIRQGGLFPMVLISKDRAGLSNTLAHEIGHALGLQHTNLDFLTSTKTFDHFIDGDQGTDLNLMDAGGSAPFVLTDEQVSIIKKSPALPAITK